MAPNNKNNYRWFPKPFTVTLFSVLIGVFTGIVINLLTGSFPTNPCLFLFLMISIVLFVLSSVASWKILNIRIEIDEEYSKRNYDNKKLRIDQDKIWEATLKEKNNQKRKFKLWKRIGIFSLAIGLILLFVVKYSNLANNIKQENRLVENSTAIVDSLDHLNRKLEQQNIFIHQLKDSIQDIKNEIRISKDVNDEKEKTTN